MRRTNITQGAYVLYDKLRVDWRQYFSREDAKLMAEDRLHEAIQAQKTIQDRVADDRYHGRAMESTSASRTDEVQKGFKDAWRIAITCTPPPLPQQPDGVSKSTKEGAAVPESLGANATIATEVVKTDRLMKATNHISSYMRTALEDGVTIETIPRRLGKPLSLPEANELSQLFTEVHSIENFSKLLLHLTEDLGQPLTSKHFHDLLRLFVFGRDKSCCDRTLAAIVKRGLVCESTFARMIDAHHIFLAPKDAVRKALGVIHMQSYHRRSSLAVRVKAVEESETVEEQSVTDLTTSHTLSSLLHLFSSGSHHSLLSLITVVWMRALGVELSNWDWAHLTQTLCTRPQDYVLVKGVMEVLETPPPPKSKSFDNQTPSPSESASVSARRLPQGYVSVQSLLYGLHRHGAISDKSYDRLRALVRDINVALTEGHASTAADSLNGGMLSQEGIEKLFEHYAAQSMAAGKASTRGPLSQSEIVFSRYDSQESAKAIASDTTERPRFFSWMQGMSDVPAEKVTSGSSSTIGTPDSYQAPSDANSGDRQQDTTIPKMSFSDTIVHQSLPIELEALLGAMIQNLAVESILTAQNKKEEKSASSSVTEGLLSPLAGPNVFVKNMKAPIFVGFLNRRFASPTAMILAMLEQAATQRHSVGPYRENAAHLYHYYSLILSTMKNDVEAIKVLAEADRVGKIWTRLYGGTKDASISDNSGTNVMEPKGNHFLLSDAMEVVNNQRKEQQKKGKESASRNVNNESNTHQNVEDLARLIFTPRTSPVGSSKVPIKETTADRLLGCPFVISPQFLFDMAMIFPNVPHHVASTSAATTYISAATSLIGAKVTMLELKGEDSTHKKKLSSSEEAAISQGRSLETLSKDDQLTNAHAVHTYPLLTFNDRGFLSAYSMYFIRTTADAKAAWDTIEPIVMAHRLPPRATKKMVKIYAEICARHPPRNCKLTQKGFEERMRWALYLEARETALMLYGSGKEARDMMKHLYYSQNKLPIARDANKIAEDEKRILPFLPLNPVAAVTAAQLKAEAERRNIAASFADKLQKLNCDDPASYVAAASGDISAQGASVNSSAPKKAAAELQASLARAAYHSPERPLATGLEEVAESVLVGGPHSRLPAPTTQGSSTPSTNTQITPDGRMIEPFATEMSWIHGYQASLVPYHLYREDVFNHYPHITMANSGSLLADTVAVPPQPGTSTSEAAIKAGIDGKRLVLQQLDEKQSHLSGPVSSSQKASTALMSFTKSEIIDLQPRPKQTFVYENDGFTEDPFIPLWAYVNHVFSSVDTGRERPWLFEDTEMFVLLLKCLIYRLDWENATKLTLLFTQTSKLPTSLTQHPHRITGFADAMRKVTENAIDDTDRGDGTSSATTAHTMPDSWSFALDHATADMFDAIGDPQGFLPFKTATKLFDGKLVHKSNRMGRVQVKPLMEAAGIAEDMSDHGDHSKKRRFV